MASEMNPYPQMMSTKRLVIGLAVLAMAGAGGYGYTQLRPAPTSKDNLELSSQSRRNGNTFTPSAAEWATLTIEPVCEKIFRAEHVTEGKVAVDEDRST